MSQLLDIRPEFPLPHQENGCDGDLIALGQYARYGRIRTNIADEFRGKLDGSPGTHILGRRCELQMRRVDAGALGAPMVDLHSFRDGAICIDPGPSVSTHSDAPSSDIDIPIRVRTIQANPARRLEAAIFSEMAEPPIRTGALMAPEVSGIGRNHLVAPASTVDGVHAPYYTGRA